MRIAVQAEDGDEVSITADFLSVEQAIVTLEIENEFGMAKSVKLI